MSLISPEYKALNQQMHKTHKGYGTSGHKWGAYVATLCRLTGTLDVLDYGCGKGTLAKSLNFDIHEYDPAISAHRSTPSAHSIVVCTDVLEHIEPECLEDVLQHLHDVTNDVALLSASLRHAKKNLPDGRNAHLIVEEREWWAGHIGKHFDVIELNPMGEEEYVVLAIPKEGPNEY